MTGSERVMVFGAGGFLGSAICRLLADRGIEHPGAGRSDRCRGRSQHVRETFS
ncbi:hypothetical protein ACFPJ1_06300 [Kribbella qitaiheensis]|uniref:hypothetical protein n=1 Tax=Kribbella qitaiheensis TaxID=1544730 RepID=UPI0036079777